LPTAAQAKLVNGIAVIFVDYFIRMLATVRGLFGGNVHAYETLSDCATR
jgi:hypothetical protein